MIDEFRRLCIEGKIHWTAHGLKRMQARGITIADVKNCIMHGEIIEAYPDDSRIRAR